MDKIQNKPSREELRNRLRNKLRGKKCQRYGKAYQANQMEKLQQHFSKQMELNKPTTATPPQPCACESHESCPDKLFLDGDDNESVSDLSE